MLYVTSAWSKVFAFDAKSGRLLWKYDPQVPGQIGIKGCCDVVTRGLAAWEGRIYLGAYDGRLIALDARNGRQVWSVQTTDTSKYYTITGVPRIADGKVFIGNAGSEIGVRGYVSAYDAKNGKLLWRSLHDPRGPGAAVRGRCDAPRGRYLDRRPLLEIRWRHGLGRHGLRPPARSSCTSAPPTARRG